jgi:hypothetical protein
MIGIPCAIVRQKPSAGYGVSDRYDDLAPEK